MKSTPILALCLVICGCAQPQSEPASSPAIEAPAAPAAATPLSTHHWRLSEAKDASGQRIEALFANPGKPLQLDFDDGRIAVSNTCNRMGGAYSVEGDRLKFERLASTMMACADARLMALDQEASTRLQGSVGFARTDDTLALTTGNGDVLTFQGEPTAETRHGGPGETVFLEVAPQTKACSHPLIPDMQCLQVRELGYDAQGLKTGAEGGFGHFYDSIHGYQHEPGVRNVLRVKRYAVKNPPADASALAYELDMVVESETVKP